MPERSSAVAEKVWCAPGFSPVYSRKGVCGVASEASMYSQACHTAGFSSSEFKLNQAVPSGIYKTGRLGVPFVVSCSVKLAGPDWLRPSMAYGLHTFKNLNLPSDECCRTSFGWRRAVPTPKYNWIWKNFHTWKFPSVPKCVWGGALVISA